MKIYLAWVFVFSAPSIGSKRRGCNLSLLRHVVHLNRISLRELLCFFCPCIGGGVASVPAVIPIVEGSDDSSVIRITNSTVSVAYSLEKENLTSLVKYEKKRTSLRKLCAVPRPWGLLEWGSTL